MRTNHPNPYDNEPSIEHISEPDPTRTTTRPNGSAVTDLLELVDDLTLPRHERIPVGDRMQIVTHDALLTQLDERIGSAIGGTASGSGLASERNILDFTALHQFMRIGSTIRDWCRALRAPLRGNPADDLRAWYVATLTGTMSHEVQVFHERKLTEWANTIRGILDPPRERDLPNSCPQDDCEATTWWRDGVEYPRPLVIRYRDGGDLIATATVHCRACGTPWTVQAWADANNSPEFLEHLAQYQRELANPRQENNAA